MEPSYLWNCRTLLHVHDVHVWSALLTCLRPRSYLVQSPWYSGGTLNLHDRIGIPSRSCRLRSPTTMIGAMQMPGMFAPQPQALPAQFTQHVQAAGQQMMEATGSPPGPSGGGPPPGAVVDNHRGTQYRVIAELGAGCFGTVCKVQRQSDGKVLAMKVQGLQSHAQLQEIQKEVGLLRQLRHDNVVSFFEDFGHQGGGGMTSACIIMEFCDGGTLQAHIESRKQQGFSDLRIAGLGSGRPMCVQFRFPAVLMEG